MVETERQRCPCGGSPGQDECDRPVRSAGLCNAAYKRLSRARLKAKAEQDGTVPRRKRRLRNIEICPRCWEQLDALEEDRGWGNRVRYFISLTRAEFAAYLLGWYDAMGGDVNAIDKARAIRRGEDVTWWKEQHT